MKLRRRAGIPRHIHAVEGRHQDTLENELETDGGVMGNVSAKAETDDRQIENSDRELDSTSTLLDGEFVFMAQMSPDVINEDDADDDDGDGERNNHDIDDDVGDDDDDEVNCGIGAHAAIVL